MASENFATGTTERIAVIDGLRGFAALSIILTHLNYARFIPAWEDSWFSLFGHPVSIYLFVLNTSQAVTLFFVLSGFVLTYPYFTGQKKMEGLPDVWRFIAKRAKRLLPLYFIALLWCATFIPSPETPRVTLQNIGMIGTLTFHFFHPDLLLPYDPVMWSLEVEWWCSLALPFLLLCLRRWTMNQIVLASIAFSLSFRILFIHGLSQVDIRSYLALNNAPTRLDAFVIGMGIAYFFARNPMRSAPRQWAFYGGGISMLLAGFVVVEIASRYEAPIVSIPLSCLLVTIGWSMLTLGFLYSRSFIVRLLLCNRPIRMTGRMCYSIYAWHVPAIEALQPMLNMWRFARFAVLLALVSWTSYRYIEFRDVQDWRTLLPKRITWRSEDDRNTVT